MPRYDFECEKCGVEERLLPMDQSDLPQFCRCGGPMVKVHLRPPAGFVKGFTTYRCPVTDAVIDSRKAHDENLKRQGCRVLEAGEHEDAARRRKEMDAALDRGVEETVEREIALMPGDKLEKLGQELEHGADADIVRQTPNGN